MTATVQKHSRYDLQAFYKRLGQGWLAIKTLIGTKERPDDNIWHANDQDIYVQTIHLNVDSLPTAKRAISIMLSRLSPLTPDKIYWDVAGPIANGENQPIYQLAIIRKSALSTYTEPETGPVTLHQDGHTFQFFTELAKARLGQKVLISGLCAMLLYCLFWGALSVWAQRFDTDADSLDQLSRQLSVQFANQKLQSEIALRNLDLIKSYTEQHDTRIILDNLKDIALALGDADSLVNVNAAPALIELTALTDNSSGFSDRLGVQMQGATLQVQNIVSDRVNSRTRVTLDIVPQISNETTP